MNRVDTYRSYWRELVLLLFLVANIIVWGVMWARSPGETMTVRFFDIGQGDAILISSPSHGRVLIDGGPNRQVLSELGKALPFGDRRIDVVIATHPDADHIGGLPAVVLRYDVGALLEPGVESDNSIDDELRKRAEGHGVPRLEARRGLVVDFGDGAKLTVLYPVGDVSELDPNDASIVARLVYGESEFLFTGDAGLQTEIALINLAPEDLVADVLKAGHHGSRTSTSEPFATAVKPLWAVISAGKDNRYGHPHKEVLDTLDAVGSQILSTAELGTITFETDGKELRLAN